MTRVCVIINDVGGIPHTLHENVLSNHTTWAESSHIGIPLPSTDRTEGFQRVTHGTSTESVFSVAAAHDITTALVGPSCGSRRIPADTHSLFDPESTLTHMGVKRCSPYDDACLLGRSDVYDEHALRDATDIVHRHEVDKHLLLWVNLLALRDVDRIHASTSTSSNPRWMDRRSHPESLHSTVSRVTDAVAREFHERDTPQSIPRHTETEFSVLLEHSVDALGRHLQRVQRFVLSVLQKYPNASILHTASHSLALGEHGMRGGKTPMSTTCTTFVSSRPTTSRCQNLDAILFNFILHSFQLAHPPEVGQPVTRVPSLGLTRTLVPWNDHMYAVVECRGVIQNVFDLSTDPFELNDIVGNVTHIRHPLQLAIRPEPRGGGQKQLEEYEVLQPRPEPVSVPSPSTPEVSTTTTRTRQASFTRRPRQTGSTNTTEASQNVRRVEQRLNKLHR